MLAACVMLSACSVPPRPSGASAAPATFTPVAWSDVPGFAADRVSEAWPAFLVGCRALLAAPARAATWKAPCEAARAVDGSDDAQVRAFFAAHFSPYRIASAEGGDRGLVTGYYEAKLDGARERSERFTIPLYGRPDDLVTIDIADVHPELATRRVRGRVEGKRVVSYWSRADIERGRAQLQGNALAWVADPLDAFFLEIQGSGRIALADGGTLRLGYADQNGRPYRAVGRVLVERGELALDDVSLQSIREWARRNPSRVRELLDQNESFVFFREIARPPAGTLEASIDGPQGSLGVPLLAARTIAVDATAIPLGAPVWLETTGTSRNAPLARLVLAQDTGGAIRGAVRADFFFGFGDEAMRAAGTMRDDGRMWLLWPTSAPLPGTR